MATRPMGLQKAIYATRLPMYYRPTVLTLPSTTITSCYSNGSDSPHRRRRTDRSVVFARRRQCEPTSNRLGLRGSLVNASRSVSPFSRWRIQKIVLGAKGIWGCAPSGGAGGAAPRSWGIDAFCVMVKACS